MSLKEYSPEEIRELLKRSEGVFYDEPIVIDLSDVRRAYVVGDLHGDAVAASIVLKLLDKSDEVFIFLGDYVDRGTYGAEVFCSLVERKLDDPQRVIMLRGNHECQSTNRYYGFYDELAMKWWEEGAALWDEFNRVFSFLPLAARVDGGRLVCLHGGIPRRLRSLDDLRRYRKGWLDPEDEVLLELLWNDPDESIDEFAPNFMRGPGVWLFGRKAFERFMQATRAELMIRAHTYIPEGARWFFDRKLLSIFSPIDYVGRAVNGSIALYDRGEVKVIELKKLR